MHLHRRQFVIGPRPIDKFTGWVNRKLEGIGYITHCPELRLAQASGADGKSWTLFGRPVQSKAGLSIPIDEIASATSETIQDCYHSWTGRWILVGDGNLHMDCSGLLSCFYGFGPVSQGRKELWVSSSPAVLALTLGLDPTPKYKIEHGYGIDWFTPPASGIDGIRRQQPDQLLDLLTGRVTVRRLKATLPGEPDYNETLDALQACLVTAVANVADESERLWLPLTGGHDSRTFLAIAKHTGRSFRAFTHTHPTIAASDLSLPPQLTRVVGIEHLFFGGGDYSPDLENLYDQHTAGHTVDRDRFYFSHDYFKWCRLGDMLLRSHCVEIGRGGRGRFPVKEYGREIPDVEVLLEQYKKRGFEYAGRDPEPFFPPALYEALGEWVDWVRSTPSEGIDWRDRWTIDQGTAGWLGPLEQSLDLIDAERFYAANSHLYLTLALRIPEEKRQPKTPYHQHELIKRMAPQLMKFPFNPPERDPFHRRVAGRLGKIFRTRQDKES